MLWATGFRRLIRGGERVREVKIAGVRGYSLREKTIRATGSAVAPRMEQVGGPAGGSRASSDAMARVLGHPGLVLLGDLFRESQFELRLAGGVVRDILLGLNPNDIDLATPATPEEMMGILERAEGVKVIPTGLKHGTVTAVVDHVPFEITTLRIDTDHDGRHCDVQFTTDWKLDAERRDLTINAMMMDLSGTVFDYFDGQRDLIDRRVRFVGNPEQRLEEDHLRILRYYRFHGRISKRKVHDELCVEAISRRVDGLHRISGERIRSEMVKILEHPSGPDELEDMAAHGVTAHIAMPSIEPAQFADMRQVTLHSSDPITRLAAVLESAEAMQALHDRWKFTNKELVLALFLIEHRDGSMGLTQLKEALVTNKVTQEVAVELLRYRGQLDDAAALADWSIPKFPASGKELMKRTGMKGGRQLGALLQRLRSVWIEKDYAPSAEELYAIALELNVE